MWKASEEETEEELSTCVKVCGNNVYYYGEINNENILYFTTEFKKLEIKLLKDFIEYDDRTPVIYVHINSGGGDVFAGFAALDTLRSARVKVVTQIEGLCASAATFMFLGGAERRMGRHSQLLIHQMSTNGFWGKYEELKDEMKSCTQIMKMLKKLYSENTDLPQSKLGQFMKRDIYMTANECLKYNIIHGIV